MGHLPELQNERPIQRSGRLGPDQHSDSIQFFANNDGGPNDYNGDWIRLELDLTGYVCGADCWWKLNYDYSGATVNDTTTWKAYIVGNPVHLLK